MTDSTQQETSQAQPFKLSYQQASDFHADHLHLFSQLERDAVQFQGKPKDPIAFREALASLFAIVSSDYRYVPKDRSAYVAYMQMRRSHQNQGLAKAHRAYFDWLLKNDPLTWLILDPVIHVHEKGLSFEVFSKDEGCYAQLSLDKSFFEITGDVQCGTTNIDFSPELAQAIEQMRSERDTQFSIAPDNVAFKAETATDLADAEVLEKRIQVPQSWLRGFLQVQSSAQLPCDSFQLNPIDLYNALFHLRMHADEKGKRRGLRIELVPKEAPRLVLEPNDTVITGTAETYQGKQAKIIRLWGRRRLALLKRFVPYAETIEVKLLGNGMPSFWLLKGKGMTLTFAVTGFTASNWSQALNFDLLLPRRVDELDHLTSVVETLKAQSTMSLNAVSKATGLSKKEVSAALQQACQQGLVMYELSTQQYRYRPLTQEPLDMARFQFRQPAEALAYDLVARQNAVSELSLNAIPNEGIEISADIKVKEDKREYLTRLKLNEEGHVAKAECSCHQIMQHGLTQGACSHLIALRLAYAAQVANRDVGQLTQETRLFMRRKQKSQDNLQLTLNNQRMVIVQQIKQHEKRQQFAFNSVQEARQAYLDKIAQLEMNGFIEG